MMPLSGVRSSWLTLLIKASFCSITRFSSWMSVWRWLSWIWRMTPSRLHSMPLKLLSIRLQLNTTCGKDVPARKEAHTQTGTYTGVETRRWE
jgi:hypothetical protein